MLTREGHEISKATAAHKFGGDPMAEYLYDLTLSGFADEDSGDVDCPTGSFARIGRQIVFSDGRGFVWREKYPDVLGARQMFEALDRYYGIWADDDESRRFLAEIAESLADADRFLAYVVACARENCEAFTHERWTVFGCPAGPLG